MKIANRITGLLTGLTSEQLQVLTRTERRLLSDQLGRVEILIGDAERAANVPRSGVLADLRRGRGDR
jgi:hypothetical protein